MVCMHRSQRTGLADLASPAGAGPRARRARPCRRRWTAAACGGHGWRWPRRRRPAGPTAGAMWGVWNAPGDLQRAHAGSRAAGPRRGRPAAPRFRRRRSGRRRSRLAAVSPWRSAAARTSSGSPPRTALIPVGVVAARRGHRPAPLADQDHGLLGAEHAGRRRCGDLADRVAGAGADPVERVGGAREHRQQGDQAGADEQGLGDRGVPDGVGVRRGAVPDQVDAGHRREPLQPLRGRRGPPATGRGIRGSGSPDRARR